MAALKDSAARRLQHDLKELHAAPPLPLLEPDAEGSNARSWGVTAMPRDNDIFTWDVKMVAASGPLEGRKIRMKLVFPDSYPSHPPAVELRSSIHSHPNVFGDWICLDMLKEPEWYAKPYEGWSAAYSLSGILLQLYGFLLVDESVDQMGGGRVSRRGYEEPHGDGNCGRYDCKICRPAPVTLQSYISQPETVQEPEGAAAPMEIDSNNNNLEPGQLEKLDDYLLRTVLSNLDAKDLLRCMQVGNSRLTLVAMDVKQRKELVCFYSKLPYTDTVLGFGVDRQYHGGYARNQPSSSSASSLRSLGVRLDYLSLEAFSKCGVRKSAWNGTINGFLPLYLNPEHGQRSLAVLPACVSQILARDQEVPNLTSRNVSIPPRQLLAVLSQAMNSLVVEICKVDGGEVLMHMSDAALRGFAHLHHLLLAVALSANGAALIREARNDVLAFIRGADGGKARHKVSCPDLGVLVVELLLVPKEEVSWSSFLPPFLRELLARQVRWVLKGTNKPAAIGHNSRKRPADYMPGEREYKFGVIAGEDMAGDSNDSHLRMKAQFESAYTGLCAMQLTCWFGLALARPRSVNGLINELTAVKRSYDQCSGAPQPQQLEAFHSFAKKATTTAGWAEALAGFNAAIRVQPGQDQRTQPRKVWATVLRQAVIDSYVAGYHDSPSPFQGHRTPVAGMFRKDIKAEFTAPSKHDWQDVTRSNGYRRSYPEADLKAAREGPWKNLHAPDPRRLEEVCAAFGCPLVDWEGDDKPVAALQSAVGGA